MKKTFIFSAAAWLAMVFPAQAALKIAATTPSLAALAREVGGKYVEVTSLSLPTQDPHFVDAQPSLALMLNRSDLLLVTGLQLETGWLPVLQNGARNPAIRTNGKGYFDCSTAVKVIGEGGAADRSQGDIHPGGNPHYLLDPHNAKLCAKAIAGKITALDPEHAKQYAAQYDALAAAIDNNVQKWQAAFMPYAGVSGAVYHRSWNYLFGWLKLRIIGEMEPKPGIAPNPAHLAQLMASMKREKAKFLLQESYYPASTSKLVSEKAGVRFVTAPGGPTEKQTYLEYLNALLQNLLDAVKS